jgi:glycosyltransferase involved in cell wall biosynthesis
LIDTAKLFLAMSEDMQRDLISLDCPANKILVHHTGVNVDRFVYKMPRSSDSRLRILTICTYEERRGFPYLIRAFAKVLQSFPQGELRIIGRPAEHNVVTREVDALIRELNLDDHVTQVGRVEYSRLTEEYHNADIFALSSVTGMLDGDKEGIPTVLLEAQATGLPVVSTKHAGIPEAVLDGQSGYLTNERDIDALAEKLCVLLGDRHLRERMGIAGREHIEKEFNIVTQVQKLERIYDRLVEGQWE